MRKFALFFLSIILLFQFSSCKDELNLELYLSQLRISSYTCSLDDYTVTAYAEEREDPFISDGYVGGLKKIITVKIENYKQPLDNAEVTLKFPGAELSKKFEYSPLTGKFTAEIETSVLPSENTITAIVKNQGEERVIELNKFSVNEIIDYKSALNSVSKKHGEKINKMLENNSSIEVRLRLIVEGERGYYYVSITDKNGDTLAYLIDGLSGEILASKNI